MPATPRHRARPRKSTRVAKRTAWVLGLISVIVITSLVVIVKHLEGNITEVDVTKDLGKRPVKTVSGPVNVLVMGDDTRKGQGPAVGGVAKPGLSDTTILLHLSADRKRAYGVSLPRDAMVQRPSCRTRNGVDQGGLTQFNAAYTIGGPACTIKTVEHLTDIQIDHFVVIKFSGFRKMVDAIGGVQVCLPQEIDDNLGKIHLPEGTYDVTGNQALDYVRVRHGIGDGSDVGRMKRQQAFIASMINKVVSAGTLANPVRLLRFLDAATESLITDPGFSKLQPLVGLGTSLKDIGLDRIRFITVPFQAYAPDPNRLEWAPGATKLWNRIRNDRPIGTEFSKEAVTAEKKPGAAESSSAKPGTSPSADPSATSSPTASAQERDAKAAATARLYGLCP